jgi:hypothetical protein
VGNIKSATLAAAAALTVMATLGIETANAAPTTVGVADMGSCYPALCNDSGTSVGQNIDYQQVYGASAFSGPLTITSISFFFDAQAGGTGLILSGNYLIDLGYAANGVGALITSLNSNIVGTESLFASASSGGNDSANPTATINGQTPFNYDPANGDLLLEIIASNQSIFPTGTGNGYFEADDTGQVTSRAYCVTSQTCVADSAGLVTEFNLEASDPAPVPEPVTLSIFGAGLAGAIGMRRRRKAAKA